MRKPCILPRRVSPAFKVIPNFSVYRSTGNPGTQYCSTEVRRMKKYQRIRDLREDADLFQRDLARTLNCSQQTYSDY